MTCTTLRIEGMKDLNVEVELLIDHFFVDISASHGEVERLHSDRPV